MTHLMHLAFTDRIAHNQEGILRLLGVAMSLLASLATLPASAKPDCLAADLVLVNTSVYTADDAQWQAQAVAIKDGLIVYVGSNHGSVPWQCGAQDVLDLAGSTVFPGFVDSHQHLEGVGRRTRTLSLFGQPTLRATVNEIARWAQTIPEGNWVLGRGWIEREWTDEQRFLTRWDVDAFTKNKPLYMPRADGVSALVNSKALAMAGITRDTPDPDGGKFERDADGELTGYVLAKAMEPFRQILPPETNAYIQENLARGMAANAALGWTATHDMGMSWRELAQLQALNEKGVMGHRVYVAVPIAEAESLIARGPMLSPDGLLDVRGIKVFIDGTLGSRGAALLTPYADAEHRGFMNRTTKAQLMPVLEGALRQGLQVMTHVIGDRALRSTLDWYTEAWASLPKEQWATEDLRWRLEHAQIIPPKDQQRLVAMQVIPSMQPSHAIGDLNFAPARLGAERLAYAYPWQPLIDRGLKIVAGSDAPVEAGDPRIEFYAAITRARLDGTQGKDWRPEYAVSRANALRMLTLWPAYSVFQERNRGSITVGKQADITVFNTDFMTAKPSAILAAKTQLTIVDGRISYQAL